MSPSAPPHHVPPRPVDSPVRADAVPALADGERDSVFESWLATHKGILFKVVHAHAFEPADREDLFQEVVLQVWRSVDAFRGQSSVPTWLYRVALNTALAWTRREGRHHWRNRTLHEAEGLLTTSAPEARDPRVEWLYGQIAQLKDIDRSVALLLLDGFSYKEISAVVGLTEGNVGVRINRIKSVLIEKRMKEDEL
jgi:RNA polymerase sigma-70 factor (ECF subfamily)